jgi:hypothetical protein
MVNNKKILGGLANKILRMSAAVNDEGDCTHCSSLIAHCFFRRFRRVAALTGWDSNPPDFSS